MRALSPKALREIREFVDHAGDGDIDSVIRDAPRLLAAIDYALKPKRSLAPARKRRTQKKATKNEQTAAIRHAVFERAEGKCEICGDAATDMDHAFGRVREPQKVSNCVALCRVCHVGRTNSRGGAAHWWRRYAELFERRGNLYEASLAHVLWTKHASRPRLQGKVGVG